MRNDLVNKKVVSSIGIGIMALVTAVSPSMGVFAEEAEGDSLEQDAGVEQASEQAVESEAQNAEVSNEIADAQDAIDEAQKKIEAGNTLEGLDENEYISDPSVSKGLEETDKALGALDQDIEGLDEANQDAAEKKEDWEETLDAATNEEGNGWLDHVSEDTSESKDAAEGLGEIINDEIASEAEGKAEEVEESQKVTYKSEEAAQEAKDQANETAKEVEEVRDQAQEAYDEAAEKLEIAENNREIADELWKSAEKSYNDAVAAVDAAKAELERILAENGIDAGDLDPETLDPANFSGNVKAALENAAAALARAEVDAKTAAENVEKARRDLVEAEKALVDANGKKEMFQGTLNDLNGASMELESAKGKQGEAEQAAIAAAEALKKAQQELLAGEAKEQQENSKNSYEAHKKAKDDLQKAILPGEIKEALKAEKEVRDNKNAIMNKWAETQIKYELQRNGVIDDIDEVEFSEWISTRNENNCVMVTYKGKDGEIHYEYYDYIENDENITVVKKNEPDKESYGNMRDVQLNVKEGESGQEFWLGNTKLTEGDVSKTGAGYILKIPGDAGTRQEIGLYYNGNAGVRFKLVEVEWKGIKAYFVNGKETPVKIGPSGIIEEVDGKSVTQSTGWRKTDDNSEIEIFFGPTFTGKGEDCNITIQNSTGSLSDLQEAAEKARADKNDRDNELTAAKENVLQAQIKYEGYSAEAIEKLKEAGKEVSVNEVEKALTGFISELVESINTLETSRNAAAAEKTKREGMNSTADAIFEKIKGVNTAVTYAIKKLADLSAQSGVDKAQYEAAKELYDKAVENCLVAAEKKGASEADLNRIKAAADRARAAADAQFAYNTSETNPGDGTGDNTNPGGGTGDNTNPGGGTTGGETNPGGGTGDNTNPGGGTTGGETNPGGGTGGNANPGDGTTGGNTNPGGGTTGGNTNPGGGTTEGNTNPGGGIGGNTNPGGGTGGNTNPGGTTEGNTNPGGGITGGGAGTGTTGGGTGGAGTGATGGGTGGAGTGTVRAAIPAAAGPIVAIPTAAVPLAGPDAIVADAGEEAGATDGLTTLEDGATPLASADNMTETENLEDEETPLVNPSEGQIQMSWWWLLVIALLGVSGEEMYRKYMKKARAKKIED